MVGRNILKGLLNALGALFEHLELLVAESHIVEHYEKIELVSPTQLEVDHVHDAVSLLKQVEGLFPLFPLNELDR